MPITLYHSPNLTPYVRFNDDDHTTLPMDAGTGGDTDLYTLTDADIEAAELPAGNYEGVIRNGDWEDPDPSDEILGDFSNFTFDGEDQVASGGLNLTIQSFRT